MTNLEKLNLLRETRQAIYEKGNTTGFTTDICNAQNFIDNEIEKIHSEIDMAYFKREGLQSVKDSLDDIKILSFIQDEINKIDVKYTFTHNPTIEEFRKYQEKLIQAITQYNKNDDFSQIETTIKEFIDKILLKFYQPYNSILWYYVEYEETLLLVKEIIKTVQEKNKQETYEHFLKKSSRDILNWISEVVHWNISSFRKFEHNKNFNERKQIIKEHLQDRWKSYVKYDFFMKWTDILEEDYNM